MFLSDTKKRWNDLVRQVLGKKGDTDSPSPPSETKETSQNTLTLSSTSNSNTKWHLTLYEKGPAPRITVKCVNNTSVGSRRLLEETLAKPGTPPTIVLPPSGYWVDGVDPYPEEEKPEAQTQPNTFNQVSNSENIDTDDTATLYRQLFLGKEHINLVGFDENQGPLVMSLKNENIDGRDHIRILLRLRTETIHRLRATSKSGPMTSVEKIAKMLKEQVNINNFTAVMCLNASSLIAAYDEHVLVNRFKFGVLYQRYGQTTEEDLFGNNETSPAFNDFLEMLGQKIQLKEHKGYPGGLDVMNGHTGTETVYEQHHGREIMFHVAPLLPHTAGDSQQVQRKRHVGNDIVAIIFQDKETPFTPNMISSRFLHAFIVVTHLETADGETRYKVAVTARDDVPFFRPTLSRPSIYRKGPEFKEFLLTKLINAENACYKAEKFARLKSRTQASLLQELFNNLDSKTKEFLGSGVRLESGTESKGTLKKDIPRARYVDTVKKVLISKDRIPNVVENDEYDYCEFKGIAITLWSTNPEKSSAFGTRSESSGEVKSTQSVANKLYPNKTLLILRIILMVCRFVFSHKCLVVLSYFFVFLAMKNIQN